MSMTCTSNGMNSDAMNDVQRQISRHSASFPASDWLISMGIVGITRTGNAWNPRLVNGALRLSDSPQDDHSQGVQVLDGTWELTR